MYKVGVIGLGAIGERLIQSFVQHPSTEVVAVCDQLNERVVSVAEKLGGIQSYTNHQQMLGEVELDLVYIAVPPKYHHAIAADVINKGIHLLCEKPLANSVEEAFDMKNKAETAGIVHAMNFPLNYGSAANTFAKLIEEKYVGKLRRLELTMHFPQWPRFWQQNDWVASREQGGFVLEVGVHFIQQAQRIFGSIAYKNGQLELPENPTKSEIGVYANLELEDGTPFIINGLSDIAGDERIAFTAYGTEGTLSLVNWGMLEGGKVGESIAKIEPIEVDSSSLIDNLVRALNGEKAKLYDFNAGYDAQVILEKLRGNE
ncbi:Gfo/Idh/MocA family oxidoreductase [Bacillus luteolus]|uniref:Gfo/Idh/MocA family oxidoreductase n=1 Tax=Litchfieldia luteola TaxID=682179 RepID=A0ABR9QEH0_9BACI|nr:Gfo/Idh/MocA family oxidoreductase [Cytobacillus luteolus]